MKIKEITPEVCDQMRKVVNDTLAPALAEYGLELNMKTMRYDSESIRIASFKIELADADPEEVKSLARELETRKKYDWMEELDGERAVVINGSVMVKLWGHNPRARKKPFLAKDVTKLDEPSYFPMTEERAVALFGKSAVANT